MTYRKKKASDVHRPPDSVATRQRRSLIPLEEHHPVSHVLDEVRGSKPLAWGGYKLIMQDFYSDLLIPA